MKKSKFQTDEQSREILFYNPSEYPYLNSREELDTILNAYSMTEPGISGKELL